VESAAGEPVRGFEDVEFGASDSDGH
jgi:hypothetical protein